MWIAERRVLTPCGDAGDTLDALEGRQATSVPPASAEPLDAQLKTFLAAPPADLDACLLATTKGDCPLWCDDILTGGHLGGPAWCARQLTGLLDCPTYALSGACASGPLAVAEAARLIRHAGLRRVLVVGADRPGPFVREGFSALGTIDPCGCRPFDVDRQGLAVGEAVAAVVIDRETGAVPLSGWAGGCDANHLTGPRLDGTGLTACCGPALHGLVPAWVVAHGTGTRQNDDAESLAYQLLDLRAPITGWKGLLGHTLGTCGVAEIALAAEILATGRPVPGTANLRNPGCAGEVEILPPGPHPPLPGPVLSANAGFGGINGAVVLGGGPPPDAKRRGRPRLLRRVVADHLGLRVDGECRLPWPDPAAPGTWPRITARTVTGGIDVGWGRMDTLCRLQVALARQLEAGTACAQVLLSDTGCVETDRAVETARRAGNYDPQRFAYTLSTAAIGEASIRCGWRGPGQALAEATDEAGRRSVHALLADGVDEAMLSRIETEGPQPRAWAEHWAWET